MKLDIEGLLKNQYFAQKGLQQFEVRLRFLVEVEVLSELLFQVEPDLKGLYVGQPLYGLLNIFEIDLKVRQLQKSILNEGVPVDQIINLQYPIPNPQQLVPDGVSQVLNLIGKKFQLLDAVEVKGLDLGLYFLDHVPKFKEHNVALLVCLGKGLADGR